MLILKKIESGMETYNDKEEQSNCHNAPVFVRLVPNTLSLFFF